ncbi:MAG TPA: DUF4383 domain-containing protein [Pyrinomonadaceae bacterium]|jgi:hypothetical protein
MAKTICKLLGVVLLLVGIVGLVPSDAARGLMGTHLSIVHSIVHIASGALALYFGFAGTLSGARLFSLAFGAVYLLLGVVGFVAGTSQAVSPGMPGMSPDTHLFKPLQGVLELGTMDHVVHLLLGLVFLVGGVMTRANITTDVD